MGCHSCHWKSGSVTTCGTLVKQRDKIDQQPSLIFFRVQNFKQSSESLFRKKCNILLGSEKCIKK